MIFIDASALTAIITDEPAAEPLVRCLESDATFFTSGIAIYETALAVARIANCSVAKALSDVHDLVARSSVSIEAIDAAHAEQALVAFAFRQRQASRSTEHGRLFRLCQRETA